MISLLGRLQECDTYVCLRMCYWTQLCTAVKKDYCGKQKKNIQGHEKSSRTVALSCRPYLVSMILVVMSAMAVGVTSVRMSMPAQDPEEYDIDGNADHGQNEHHCTCKTF